MDPTQGQPVAPLPVSTAPTQAPMTVDQLQGLINSNAATTQQDIQNEPTVAAQQRALIFGNDPTLTSLQSNEQAKIQELFQHDQMLSQNYGAPVNQPAAPNPNGVASTAPSSTGAPATLISNPTNPQFGAENPLAAGYVLNPFYGEENMAKQDATTMSELGDLENEAQQRREVLGNVLDNVMKIYQSHLDTEKYLSDTYQTELNSKLQQQDQALKTRAEALQEAQSGYQYDPTTGSFSIMGLNDLIPGLSGSDTSSTTGTSAEERAQMQAIVSALPPQSPLRQKFEDAWQQETGIPLFPNQKLASGDQDALKSTAQTMDIINNVTDMVNKYGQSGFLGLSGFPSGPGAQLDQFLSGMGINIKPTDELGALNQLTQLQGVGDRTLIGGRLTGYLLNALGPAFPTTGKSSKLNMQQFTAMRQALLNSATELAKSQGFDNAAELFVSEGIPITGPMPGTLTITNKKTGEKMYILPSQKAQYGL
jgi:hypothetical protein